MVIEAIENNVGSLVDYFLKTGDFTEPETRLEFSDSELRELDVQRAAVFACGHLRVAVASRPLIDMIAAKETDPELRRDCMRSLGRVGSVVDVWVAAVAPVDVAGRSLEVVESG